MHQQMWCWGRDVLTKPENLLLKLGMSVDRVPDGSSGGSRCYTQNIDQRLTLSLWAFGIALFDQHFGVFLHRYQRGVRLLPSGWRPRGVHREAQLPLLLRPRSRADRSRASTLLNHILRWVESYEKWVLATQGLQYRDSTLRAWEHPIFAADSIAREWGRLSDVYRKASAQIAIFNLPFSKRSVETSIPFFSTIRL